MKTLRLTLSLLVAGFGLLQGPLLSNPDSGPYRHLTEVRIGGEGGWDYLTVDEIARRLYVSHSTRTVVLDLDKNTIVGEIAPGRGIHGVAIARDLGLLFVSNGLEATASVVDAKSLRVTGTVKTGENPDCILYEPRHREVYTFNGRSNNATVFDAASGRVKVAIPLPGKPEFAVEDVEGGRIYNNIEDKSQIVVIDTASHALIKTWSIAPGEEPTGLSIDVARHRLFTVTGNKLLIAIDAVTGKVLSTLAIGAGVDGSSFDPKTGYVFASSSDGTLTVAACDAAGRLSLVQTLATPPRSRTMTLDPKTHRLYIATADFANPQPAAPGAPPPRPAMSPDSFRVVVYGLADAPAG